MVGINQTIDLETAAKVASGYGFEVQDVRFREEELLAPQETGEQETGNLVPRPPIITVMGHVDHGKTSLLDALRKTDVVAGEAGGITQHIGAYQVSTGGRKLTFIDTPGHEAFTMMRARGAQVTDIVVLVVAATEGIMPQTVEAIDHAKAADVPIIVAVNKIDLPDANPQLTRQRLMEHGLVPEEFGGETICVNISALKRTGLEQLLEMIHLQAEVLELRADPSRRATGVVLEAELDRGRGPVATVLVQDGTLRRGDVLVVGTGFGRVRLMQNEFGHKLDEAGPATPAQVVGLSAVPEAGQVFHVVESERVGKEIVEHRIAELRGRPAEVRPRLSLEDFFAQSQDGGVKELAIVLKADVQGSLEAVRDALIKLSTDAVKVDVIHTGVGGITESDVMLAKASNAIVIGFHVRPDPAARRAAEGQGVDLRLYQIIYEATDDVRRAMAGLLPPTVKEVVLGRAEVRRTFSVPKVGTIGGSLRPRGSRATRCALPPCPRRRSNLRGSNRLAQALQGRRPRGADGLRVRHRHRRVQRPQGRGRDRGLRPRGAAGDPLMIVGVAIVELHVHGSRSLKEKRGVVRSVIQRVRNRFAVSVAEVGGQDTWQRAQIGMTTVGGDARSVRAALDRAVEFIETLGLAEVMDSDVDVLTVPHRGFGPELDEEEDGQG